MSEGILQNTSYYGRSALRRILGAGIGLYVLIAGLLLAGCVVIPVQQDAPYEEAIKTIEKGKTTRKDILFVLGTPAAVRRHGNLFAYTDFQLDTALLFLLASPEGAAFGGLGFGTNHLLALSFDKNGIVQNVELLREGTVKSSNIHPKTTHCISAGECFLSTKAGVVVFATGEEDRAAKRFSPAPDRCVVYVYDEGIEYRSVSLDNRVRFLSAPDSFFVWRLRPGEHRVTATYADQSERGFTFECAANETLYARFLFGLFEGLDLSLVKPEVGQPAVRQRRLVLDDL